MIVGNSIIVAPSNTGIAIKKDTLAALFFLIPNNSIIAIVIPDLEIPGKIAQICDNPTKKTSLYPIDLFSSINETQSNSLEDSTYFVKNKITDIQKNEAGNRFTKLSVNI